MVIDFKSEKYRSEKGSAQGTKGAYRELKGG
jgi:hypothetical protein